MRFRARTRSIVKLLTTDVYIASRLEWNAANELLLDVTLVPCFLLYNFSLSKDYPYLMLPPIHCFLFCEKKKLAPTMVRLF